MLFCDGFSKRTVFLRLIDGIYDRFAVDWQNFCFLEADIWSTPFPQQLIDDNICSLLIFFSIVCQNRWFSHEISWVQRNWEFERLLWNSEKLATTLNYLYLRKILYKHRHIYCEAVHYCKAK